ncbi:4-(cytidine 5'-diphospho)-2-C-methyl-D-erythritol kinase [Sphingobacterium sp. SGG-5]|uniref:4-(cytidine 5'-diphospho)-2-C-methyl-D-erythritol kinase n=1 Tax=Sphingobacterium sp. SGG-5 TaxID=2710881 RepID=UPI0013ECAAD3|nr:4-(cytidine 5'-diphospho)-2-C-methyl-D-erythritol kinase [Sphingobacterium sp. SGG-5]NGM61872.1 4-(cytidine 5'-diphospho)-2-C-methyl-D-erythritol kinase [Sphingobacterium sp. SGG-5]
MLTFANAKINLGLLVTEKRQDGYHNIETIFYPIKLYDVIEITAADVFQFRTEGLVITPDGQNLCEKAYRLLYQDFDIKPVVIDLLKNIPIGAGLGGGSSDGTHVLKLLNEMNGLGLSDEELKAYAVQLGADCPFFIDNKPVFASGIGTTFEAIDIQLSSYCIVIIKPDIHISTVEAYRSVIPQRPTVDLREAMRLPIQEWKYHIVNDFELGIFQKYPHIEKIKYTLYEKGALYAAMSGSGSAIFGIFEEEPYLEDLNSLGRIYYPVEL